MDINESSSACQAFHELCGVIKNMLPMRLETPSFLPCGLGYMCCTGMLEIARCVSLGTLIRMSMFMNWLNLTSLQAISVLPVLNCPLFWWFRHHYYYWLLADCTLDKVCCEVTIFWHHERGGYGVNAQRPCCHLRTCVPGFLCFFKTNTMWSYLIKTSKQAKEWRTPNAESSYTDSVFWSSSYLQLVFALVPICIIMLAVMLSSIRFIFLG